MIIILFTMSNNESMKEVQVTIDLVKIIFWRVYLLYEPSIFDTNGEGRGGLRFVDCGTGE